VVGRKDPATPAVRVVMRVIVMASVAVMVENCTHEFSFETRGWNYLRAVLMSVGCTT